MLHTDQALGLTPAVHKSGGQCAVSAAEACHLLASGDADGAAGDPRWHLPPATHTDLPSERTSAPLDHRRSTSRWHHPPTGHRCGDQSAGGGHQAPCMTLAACGVDGANSVKTSMLLSNVDAPGSFTACLLYHAINHKLRQATFRVGEDLVGFESGLVLRRNQDTDGVDVEVTSL